MIRVDNLNLLMKQYGWSKADLAREIKKTDVYVSRLLSGKASFGEKAARYIEEMTKKPRNWLDMVHIDGEYSDSNNASMTSGTLVGEAIARYEVNGSSAFLDVTKGDTLIPVIKWEMLEMLYLENTRSELNAVPKASSEGPVSSDTKWVVMNDDSMADRFAAGSKLKVVPTKPGAPLPAPGKLVVVRDKGGAFAVRRYKYVSQQHFMAEPLNAGYATLDSLRDGLTIVGLVTQALIEC